MKIASNSQVKKLLGVFVAATTVIAASSAKVHSDNFTLQKDSFVSSQVVTPKGTTNDTILLAAPSPKVIVCGEEKNARIVIDLSKNVLYKYNDDGEAQVAYLVASGKPKTPTDKGLKIVSHVESYPYKSAPESTKRYKEPWNYGPRAIILYNLNPETGEKTRTGEFIHGNNNPKSIGKYASLGCIRMDNDVIRILAKEVKRGDLVVIK